MPTQATAALLLALALLAYPTRPNHRTRLNLPPNPRPTRTIPVLPTLLGISIAAATLLNGLHPAISLPLAVAATATSHALLSRTPQPPPPDPLALATACDLLAACLRAGLPIPQALRLSAAELTGPPATALHDVAALLTLGATPTEAWTPATQLPALTRLARAARHTARSGAALADTATDLATQLRTETEQQAEARAQRATVLITAPLGLCFLPAFICLGVAPTIIGLAQTLFSH
ncbi:type II secretion system F family protein [Crossiella cryophila]|uniref:Flp pilus assembly protein TadB n=1 Tax=Crossiella cryophila TaxID=43355 RepID=A0A7W7C698_9PSEU|nr:type II secretion system F family protein [Crossiella cryophila]MBB4675257.1 Flp pilus assembly protein TadB [Crossiella cryophila]